MRFILVLLLLLIPPAAGAGNGSFRQERIRVALHNGIEKIRVHGDGILATDRSGTPVRVTFPLEVTRSRLGVGAQGSTYGGLKIASPSTVLLNGKR